MKITKAELTKIIKEEHRKLQREGWDQSDEVFDSLFQILDQELPGVGVDRSSPEGAEMVASVLERIAADVRKEAGQDLEEYYSPGIDKSKRVNRKDRSTKPTAEQMGCRKHPQTGEQLEPYWQQRMGQWVCP